MAFRLFPSLISLMVVLICLSPNRVQATLHPDDKTLDEKVTNDSGLSRRQILRMGLKSFVEAYQNHMGYHRWQIEEPAYILI